MPSLQTFPMPEDAAPDAQQKRLDEYRKRKFYWHSPWMYLLILLHILVYLIAALAVRKTAVHNVGLCSARHQRRLIVRQRPTNPGQARCARVLQYQLSSRRPPACDPAGTG